MKKVAGKLGELRDGGDASSVMWLTGDVRGMMGELVDRFAALYGTPHVIREDYADAASEVVRLTQGIDSPPAFDLEGSDYVLSFGVPLFESWSGLAQAAAARDVAIRVRRPEPMSGLESDRGGSGSSRSDSPT